jgi:hypothetical protein
MADARCSRVAVACYCFPFLDFAHDLHGPVALVGSSELFTGNETSLGMFTVVFVDDGELIFSTDLFGLEHLYIYRGANLELVSNSIHAVVVDYLARRGIRRSLNEP